ncbi:hypothetical protein GOP47_0020458 [Adiantum capillus-veneris]|uniref:AIG1-type G domain-containing protein n=1 Tax=Adiantum capillus-veneris TaxID=13818 RepID=A0A9D4Z634_ADICA|nr:hypothetical protein GOP47_0020458 [Adiantum capillus-veneris]
MDANVLPQDDNHLRSDSVTNDSIAFPDGNYYFKGSEETTHNSPQDFSEKGEENPYFLDAENVPIVESKLGSSFVPIRARVSDDVDEDYEGDIEEEGSYASTGSYDSASERMATATITDMASPVGSFVEPFPPSGSANSAQKGALMQLNELNTGCSSLDTSLLENTDQEGFRSRVLNIAKAQTVSPDDDVVDSIINALLPIVGKGPKWIMSIKAEENFAAGDFSRAMPVAKLTAEDDDETDEVDDEELGSCRADVEGGFDSGQLEEEKSLGSARGLRVRGSDEELKGQQEGSSMLPPLTVRTSFSGMSSNEGNMSIDLDNESDSGSKVEDFSPLASADIKQEGPASPLQESDKLFVKAEEKDPLLVNSGHNLSAAGEPLVSSSDYVRDAHNSPGDYFQDSTGPQVSPDSGAHKTDFEGKLRKGEGGVELEDSLMSQNLQTRQKWESTESEMEGAVGSDPSVNLPVQGDASVKARSFDLPASAFVDLVQSINEQANDNIQNTEDVQEAEKGGSTVQANLRPMNEESKSIPAEGKGSLEAELQKNAHEAEFEKKAYERRGDRGGGNIVDDDPKKKGLTESPILVAESVSSKSTADPTSDTPSLGGAGPSLAVRPVGLGRSKPSLEHAPRAIQHSDGVPAPSSSMDREESGANGDLSQGNQDAREKLQGIRIKFLRLAHRLGQPPHNAVVAQVLYRLGLAEQLRGGRGTGRPGAFSLERASVLAEEQEAAGQDDLDFVCTIMLLGKSGVGKSATVNSLFGEVKAGTDAYSPATKKVQVVTGMVHGIMLRIIDTPGLLSSFADQRHNRRVMSSVKRFIKKSPPDIVLYFDRLDMQIRDYGDLPLMQTITDTFGAAVWFNAIVALTHAASAPPDGANGVPINYEMFVAQRSHVVQQTIRQAAGDMRLMNPVSLIENHSACRTNRAGQKVLPNGHVWKSQLLLLCFASKILAEANSLLKLQDSNPVKPFGVRSRGPPLPYLLSSLLQSRAQLMLPEEPGSDDEDSDNESDNNEADSDGDDEYDDLPPFRRLTKEELMLLDKDQRKVYFEELEDRERLFMKKQLREEQRRRKERKRRMAQLPKEDAEFVEDQLDEDNASAAVPVTMPDMALPPSFDSDNPTYRYRYLDSANQWLVRPVLETHGWDHDSGYDGLNVEKSFVISQRIPALISGQVTKDKKEANLQMECAASFKNGDGKVTLAGLDIQTIGRDLAYTVRSETRFSNFKRNKTTCGLAVTTLGDTVAAGIKIEDRLQIGKRFKLLVNGGALTGKGDVAYGGSLEASIRGRDYPIDRSFSSFGLSVMNWHGDLAIGGNSQIQIQVGKMVFIGRVNLNNRGAGQISIRASSSEQVQMALVGLIPLLRAFINGKVHGSSQ